LGRSQIRQPHQEYGTDRDTKDITDETRQYLYVAVDEEMAVCWDLGDKLLQLEASIQAMQTREVAAKEGRRPSITGANRDPQDQPNGPLDPRSCTLAVSNISDVHAHHDERV
jgi:hypothetical protein